MKINFYPESDKKELEEDTKEYIKIWNDEGIKIIDALETMSELHFKEQIITAIIYNGISRSHPLLLRANYDLDTKKATVIHELGHRLLSRNGARTSGSSTAIEKSIESHKLLDLILYDAWDMLYGKEFADRLVLVESSRKPEVYKIAWQWALAFSKKERRDEFKKLNPFY